MCVHTHVRVCVVCAVSHLQSCVCQPKEGEYQQTRNGLEVQEKKNAPCLFEYFRNIYQIIIFNCLMSFNNQAYIMYCSIIWQSLCLTRKGVLSRDL